MRTAVVVGAGLAGLAAAGALARAGWRVTLLERGDRVALTATAMVLWPNGRRALQWLDPHGAWDAIVTPLVDGGVRRPDGRWLVPPRTRPGSTPPPGVVHVDDLRDALIAGLGDRVDIRTGVRVDTVRAGEGHRPEVGDGRLMFAADLLVAADGIDSVVRRALAPEAVAVRSGFATWQAVVPGYRVPRLPDGPVNAGDTLGAGYRFVCLPLGEHAAAPGGVCWAATAVGAARPEPLTVQLDLLRRWFAGWHAPVPELLAATRPEDLVPQEVRELRPLPRAYGYAAGPGGVVLLGDAAHAMPHHLGQGACLAFEDVATLRSVVAGAMPGPELAAAVLAYGRARRPRVTTVVRQSRRMSALVQARGRLALRARDAALGSLHPRLDPTPSWHPPDPGVPDSGALDNGVPDTGVPDC